MATDEIVQLTRKGIVNLLQTRAGVPEACKGGERRQTIRWQFPATAEIRIADGHAGQPWIATCRDLSEAGIGIVCDRAFETGTKLEISVHLAEATFYGFGKVRYSAQVAGRDYLTGVQFLFDEDE